MRKKLIERSLDTSINKHDLGLVKQFEDYTYALYVAALSSVAQRESVVKYAESHALQKALLHIDKKGLGIKQRIFTWILSHRYYDLLGLACRIRIKLSKMRKE